MLMVMTASLKMFTDVTAPCTPAAYKMVIAKLGHVFTVFFSSLCASVREACLDEEGEMKECFI